MFINELAQPQLLVIYPGRFQPFHKGHHAVYEWLTGKFGRNNVYIATSNKTDNLKSPFTFAEKAYFMQLTGVSADRIVQATQPYQIQNVLSTGQITVADPANTVVIFAVSEKDMDEDPRFSFAPKKDGSEPYFQPLKDIKDTVSMDQHGYIMTVPTFDFTVMNQPMRSGTELRNLYAGADAKQRALIIKDLFGRYTREAEQIMDAKIPNAAAEPVAEAVSHFVPTTPNSEHGYYKLLAHRYKKNPGSLSAKEKQELHDFVNSLKTVKEEAAGVGVVAKNKNMARDPRYSMSMSVDVDPSTPGKNLRAFALEQREPYQQAVDTLTLRWIERMNSEIDEIKERLSTEQLPANYREILKQKIEKIKAERAKLLFDPQ
jgi:cytidyltransferase-like protein